MQLLLGDTIIFIPTEILTVNRLLISRVLKPMHYKIHLFVFLFQQLRSSPCMMHPILISFSKLYLLEPCVTVDVFAVLGLHSFIKFVIKALI